MFYESLRFIHIKLFYILFGLYVLIGGISLLSIFNMPIIDMIDMLTLLSFSSIIGAFLSYISMAISDRATYYKYYI